MMDWLENALQSLQCPYAHEWKEAVIVTTSSDDTSEEDHPLLQLIVWLEDRWIQQWEKTARQSLRMSNEEEENEHTTCNDVTNNIWNHHVHRYLVELDCPPSYFTNNDWRRHSMLRIRVIHWLVACAVSEAYGNIFGAASPESVATAAAAADDDASPGHVPLPAATSDKHESDPSSTSRWTNPLLQQVQRMDDDDGSDDPNTFFRHNFPLGFTTGDDKVDRILTLVRMTFLMELEEEQDAMNQTIADWQQQQCSVAVTAAAPSSSGKANRRSRIHK